MKGSNKFFLLPAGFLALALVLVTDVKAETYYVAPTGLDSRTGTGDWTNALATVSNGVAKATDAGDVVMVSNGTYTLVAQIEISTAITVRGYNGRDHTFINGNSNRCFNISGGATLDGLTISNGYTAADGGGVRMATSSTTMNCRVVHNTADGGGGGIYAHTSFVTNCMISENSSGLGGGGIFVASGEIWDCLISRNKTSSSDGVNANGGGGVKVNSNSRIVNSQIVSNEALHTIAGSGYGGGVYANWTTILTNCLVQANESYYPGCGLYISQAHIYNCTIVSNTCTHPTDKNRAVYFRNLNDAKSTLYNCIIMFNVAQAELGYFDWGAQGAKTTNTFYNCCTTPLSGIGWSADSVNNTDADPLFVSHAQNNYRLTPGSPCVNTGTNMDWMFDAVDLDGNARIDRFNGRVDMGCYEYLHRGTIFGAW